METVSHTMYEATLTQTWERFGAHLSGAHEGLIAVVGGKKIEPQAATALESSFAALGWGKNAVTFLTIHEATEKTLRDDDLYAALEGLDPCIVVAADASATSALGRAYHQDLKPLQHDRLFGRDICTFASFSAMLANKQDKQKAWMLLKTLPKRA
ncbi:MAG: hypothetical protein RR300_02165 [Raoultibacter sp.]